MNDYYLIAEIKAVHENEGFFSVISYSDHSERFFDLKKVYIDIFGNKKEFVIEKVKEFNNYFIFKFKNFDSDKEIEFLIGKKVYINQENLYKLPEDTFYIHDLIGSIVIQNFKEIGVIEDVLQLPANDVYIIKNRTGEEILIPAVRDFIDSFDPNKKELVLKPMDDLFTSDED